MTDTKLRKKIEKIIYPGIFCDLNDCDMTHIHNPIFIEDTGGKRQVGEQIIERKCQCGGEKRRKAMVVSLLKLFTVDIFYERI